MTTFRDSPSGELVDASGGVESVFGRVGDVEAESTDYDTSLIENDSSVPGASASAALESLAGSNGRDNPSSVPGATLTEALDYLRVNRAGPAAGSALDTFSGGSPGPFIVPNEAANIGDLSWNVGNEFGTNDGWTLEKLPAGAGYLGAYRLTSPTTQSSASTGPVLYLGTFNNTLDDGPFIFADVGEVRFRARFDSSPDNVNLFTLLGLIGNTGSATVRIEFFASGTYRVRSSVNPGETDDFDTLVPVDDDFHDFTIERVSATELRFYIDGALVVTNTNPDSIPPDSCVLTPIISAGSNEAPTVTGTTFIDIDTWEFVPAS